MLPSLNSLNRRSQFITFCSLECCINGPKFQFRATVAWDILGDSHVLFVCLISFWNRCVWKIIRTRPLLPTGRKQTNKSTKAFHPAVVFSTESEDCGVTVTLLRHACWVGRNAVLRVIAQPEIKAGGAEIRKFARIFFYHLSSWFLFWTTFRRLQSSFRQVKSLLRWVQSVEVVAISGDRAAQLSRIVTWGRRSSPVFKTFKIKIRAMDTVQ
jgi:hypothetical protein